MSANYRIDTGGSPPLLLRRALVILVLMIGLHPFAVWSNEVEDNFQRVYAPRLRGLRTNQQRTQFAAQVLIPDAVAVREDTGFSILLFKRAAEMASGDPGGTAVAVSAMRALGDTHPDEKPYADERILRLLENAFYSIDTPNRGEASNAYFLELMSRARQLGADGKYDSAQASYRKAAEVAAAVGFPARQAAYVESKALKDRHELEVSVGRLKALLKRSPNSPTAARELIRLLLLELDRPLDAEAYLPLVKDPEMERIGTLAVQDTSTLTDADASELGRWYATRARTCVIGRATAETRARACFTQVLRIHSQHDAAWLEAKASLDTLQPPPPAANATN